MPTGLWHDERAIEGLPIRLVIALVVGVASLAVMMNVIAGLDAFGSTELDTKPEPEIIEPGEASTNVTVTVVDPDGEGVVNATVVASGDTATLPSIVTAETDENGTATLELDPELGPNQERGTITLDIRPPEGDYVDEQENTDILVVEG
jgi:hypothetical protein